MRWKNRKLYESNLENTRTVRKFLFLPRRFEGQEVRWLEWAYIEERVIYAFGLIADYEWREIRFVDSME